MTVGRRRKETLRLFTCDFLQQSCTARSPLPSPPPPLSLSPSPCSSGSRITRFPHRCPPSLPPSLFPLQTVFREPLHRRVAAAAAAAGGNGRRRRLRRRRRQVNQSSERASEGGRGRGSRTAEGARNRRRQIHTTDCRCSGSAHPHKVFRQFVGR